MKHLFGLSAIVIAIPLVLAQTHQSPYAGQEVRQIKAMSADEIQGYLTGQGLGFAKAAELNSYPGPKHVLELAEQLQLTDTQKAQTEKIRLGMLRTATSLGKLIVEKERELDARFARSDINSATLQSIVADIARLQGELRVAHLHAHVELKGLLSPAQIKKYNELRGYNQPAQQHQQHNHEE